MRHTVYISMLLGVMLMANTACILASKPQDRPKTEQHTNEAILISGSIIPNIFHPTQAGIYNDLINRFIKMHNGPVTIAFEPVRRAQQKFLKNRTDCYFVSDHSVQITFDLGVDENTFIYSDTINRTNIKIYTQTGKQVITSLQSLENKVVAADAGTGLGFALRKKLPPSTIVIPTENIGKSIELLELSRVDAIVAYDLDIAIFQHLQTQKAEIQSDKTFNIHTSRDSITCWNTPKAKAFLDTVNSDLNAMKEQNRYPDFFFLGTEGRNEKDE